MGSTLLNLNVAGLTLLVHMPPSSPRSLGLPTYGGFLCALAPDLELDLEFRTGPAPIHWGEVEILASDGKVCWRRGDSECEIDLRVGKGWVLLKPEVAAFRGVLSLLYSLVLPYAGALLLHSSGLIREGKSVLFLGASGAGKSTILKLSEEGGTALSDELVGVRKRNGDYCAFDTPFGRESVQRNTFAPLKALLFLNHGKENYVVPLGQRQSLLKLMANVYYPARQGDGLERVLSLSESLVRGVPAYELHFRPDPSVLEVIDDLVKAIP